jgi:diguanylate cyclase (GGDEF)-like protein
LLRTFWPYVRNLLWVATGFALAGARYAPALAAAAMALGLGTLVRRWLPSRGEEAERRIHNLANFDALTGLPNRRQFIDGVAAAAARGEPFVVLHFDLFNFKVVNETLGHAGGDRLLVEIGRHVAEHMGPDRVVARMGGDEYAVLAPGVADAQAAEELAAVILEAVEGTRDPGGSGSNVSSSIGIALYPDHGTDVGVLLGCANMALYRAKAVGKRARVVFSRELEKSTRDRAILERELRGAMERGELRLEYQPKYHMAFDRIAGAEALLRWRHPVLGEVSPVRFIPVAEESHLIVPIGRWVVEEVCRQIRAWEDEGLPSLQIALNLSPVQFRSDTLFEDFTGILERTEVLPGQIELEITEGLLMDDPEAAVGLLTRLRNAGFSLAIDDFGTGYSSLAYLKKFPVAVLKIDRSFVKDLGHDMDDRAIAASVVSLAGSLLLDVVAEGVETIEQVDLLREMGCDYIQGYQISRPLAPADFARFVRDSQTHGVEYARMSREADRTARAAAVADAEPKVPPLAVSTIVPAAAPATIP